MSSKRIYATLAILCLTLAVVSAVPVLAQQDAIPTPTDDLTAAQPGQQDGAEGLLQELDQRGENRCIQITVWAQNLETGECQEFSSPCSVPAGWTLYFDPATCTNW